jgi:cyclopropane fatty-acyl-phospholipid synthase-like methyltransferase
MEYQKKEYKFLHREKEMCDISLEKIQKVTKEHLGNNVRASRALVKDDGRMILVFRTEAHKEEMTIHLESGENSFEEEWFKVKEEAFSWSDKYENYNVYVCEYMTNDRCNYEQWGDLDAHYNAYHGIKEDDGNYSIYDVYSMSELGL